MANQNLGNEGGLNVTTNAKSAIQSMANMFNNLFTGGMDIFNKVWEFFTKPQNTKMFWITLILFLVSQFAKVNLKGIFKLDD